MSEILISDLTNKTDSTDGTGAFDVLIKTVSIDIQNQFEAGRLTGAEFSAVYLGALQSTIQQSIVFLLGKQAADKQADLIAAQINEVSEKIDLIIAQTAEAYEAVKASQDKTLRENLLNNTTITKIQEETDLLQSKDLEEIANTIRQDAESAIKITDLNYSIAIKAQQEFNWKDKNGLVIVTYTYYVDGISGATTTTTVLANVLGPVLGTTITSGNGVSVIAYDKEILISKEELINAQTLGFSSDTKQKILKQMNDGFAVVLSIAGTGNTPEANQDAAIDALTQNILDEVGATNIVPDGEVIPPAE